MSKKCGSFAFIWWESGASDIIACSAIKIKDRVEGKKIKLLWSDISGKKKMHSATIIKIGDKMELEKISIDKNGQIIESEQKAFIEDVLEQRTANKLISNNIKKLKIMTEIHADNRILCGKNILALESEINQNAKLGQNIEYSTNKRSEEVSTHIVPKESPQPSTSRAVEVNKENEKLKNYKSKSDGDISCMEDDSEVPKNLFFISDITEDQLAFQERVVASMKYSLLSKAKESLPDKLKLINQELLQNNEGKIEILKNSRVYCNENRLNVMLMKYDNHKSWKKFTTEFFVHVYGDNLKFMSAKGTRGTFGIHIQVFKCIYDLISDKSASFVPESEYVKHLNKLCSNKKSSYMN